MTPDADAPPSGSGPLPRVTRPVRILILLVSVGLTLHWLSRLIAGEPDRYPNEIAGGLAVAVTLGLLAAVDLVPSRRIRWTVAGAMGVAVVVSVAVTFSDLRISPLAILALAVCAGGLVWAASPLVPPRGTSLGEWREMKMPAERRRGLAMGLVCVNVGAAILLLSQLGRGPEPLGARIAVLFGSLVLFGAAGMFLVVRTRITD